MRVTHKMLAQTAERNLQRNMRSLDRYANQMSTGKLFNRPSLNPIGTYKTMKLSGTGLARNEQYMRNMADGIAWLSSTDEALFSVIDDIHRLRELAIDAANDTKSAGDRLAMVPEVRQILEKLVNTANTELAGLYIFGGYQTKSPPYKIAGSKGQVISSWINKESGLNAKGENGIGIALHNLATGKYAVSIDQVSIAGPNPTLTVTAEYLHGDRAGFFGNAEINLNPLAIDQGGSLALEVMETVRFQDLSDLQLIFLAGKASEYNDILKDPLLTTDEARNKEIAELAAGLRENIGDYGGENDRIVRLGARYHLYDLDGKIIADNQNYGFANNEGIYINLNKLYDDSAATIIKIPAIGEIEIGKPKTLTYEHNTPLKGDKIVLQLTPGFNDASAVTPIEYNRFSFHKDYGRLDKDGNATTGILMDWYFNDTSAARQNLEISGLKFFDIDPVTGQLITSTIKPDFNYFGTATGSQHRSLDSIAQDGVIDGRFSNLSAAIFTYIAPLEPYYVGDASKRVVEISPGVTVYTSLTGIEAFGMNDLFRSVLNFEKALLDNNQYALGGVIIQEMQDNLERTLKSMSEVGARMQRLILTEERIKSEQIHLKELRSKVEDVDLVELITMFTMQENIYQAALSTSARIIYPSLVDFMR